MNVRPLIGVGVAIAAVLASGGCGGGDGSTSDRPPVTLLQMRPVVDADAAPCASPARPLDDECLSLGPVELDSTAVETVSGGIGANGPELRIRFTTAGLIRFNKTAADSGTRRVAVLVNDVLVSAPMIQGLPLEPDVVVTGHFTPQQIDALAKAFPPHS